jgi:hypothetical protein
VDQRDFAWLEEQVSGSLKGILLSSRSRVQSTIKIWWMGLPPKVRGDVWLLAIPNRCGVDERAYEI